MKEDEYDLEQPEWYDELLPRVLPHWKTFYGTVAEYLPPCAERILELGSGTGVLTSVMRRLQPDAAITCIEIDPRMIAIASGKPELEGVTFIEGDIRGTWPEGPFDAVVTTQTLFQLPLTDRSGIAWGALAALTEEGRFINGDIFHPGDPWDLAVYLDHWQAYMLENGMSEKDVEAMLGPLEPFIRGYTLTAFSRTLFTAGFARVLAPYRYGMYGVVVAFRSVPEGE